MRYATEDLLKKLHIIIDDVKRADEYDDFDADKDSELREALLTASEQIAKVGMAGIVEPSDVISSLGSNQDYDAIQTQYVDGHGTLVLPRDFLLLGELKLQSWSQPVRELMDPSSDEAKHQASRWSCGSPQKPKAMLSSASNGDRVIEYWKAGRYQYPMGEQLSSVYNHLIERFTYVPKPRFETDETTKKEQLVAPLSEGAEKMLLYRAAGIYMEGKKESTLADRFYNISKQ